MCLNANLNPGLFVEAANECSDSALRCRDLASRMDVPSIEYSAGQYAKLACQYFDMLIRDGLVCC